jgi:hypothetical protein
MNKDPVLLTDETWKFDVRDMPGGAVDTLKVPYGFGTLSPISL